jgi:hypothetical protein
VDPGEKGRARREVFRYGIEDTATKFHGLSEGKSSGVRIRAYDIGWKQDLENVYFDWARRSELYLRSRIFLWFGGAVA